VQADKPIKDNSSPPKKSNSNGSEKKKKNSGEKRKSPHQSKSSEDDEPLRRVLFDTPKVNNQTETSEERPRKRQRLSNDFDSKDGGDSQDFNNAENSFIGGLDMKDDRKGSAFWTSSLDELGTQPSQMVFVGTKLDEKQNKMLRKFCDTYGITLKDQFGADV
jgi:hypothetical protein